MKAAMQSETVSENDSSIGPAVRVTTKKSSNPDNDIERDLKR